MDNKTKGVLTKRVDALTSKWDDDGATRGAAYIEMRDLARDLERQLAAPQSPVAPADDDENEDFREGQWWLNELDELKQSGTDDQKRAVAVVRNMMGQLTKARARLADALKISETVPVAWLVKSKAGMVRCAWTGEPTDEQRAICQYDGDTITPLYAAPTQATNTAEKECT